jgi:hypothetical protein
VSRKQLQVNFARNEVLQSECTVWARIKEVISEYAQEKAQNTMRLDADARRHLMDGLVTGAILPQAIQDARLIEAMDGRKLRIADLAGKHVIVAPEGDTRADFISQTRRDVVVVDEAFVKGCGIGSTEEFQEVLRNAVAAVEPRKAEQIVIQDGEEVLSSVSKEKTALRQDALIPKGKDFLDFLVGINDDVVRAVSQRSGYRPKPRRLLAGESESRMGWTDGATYIYIERRLLERPLDLHTASDTVLLLIHEYLHDSSDMDTHPHDLEFYKAFHDIVSYQWFGENMTAWIESRLVRIGALAATA